MVTNPEIAFSVFFGSSCCQQPLFFSTIDSSPSCWYFSIPGIFSIVFISWLKDSPRSCIMLLSFQKNSLHDYEVNEPSYSYYTLIVIVRKNLTAFLKGSPNFTGKRLRKRDFHTTVTGKSAI